MSWMHWFDNAAQVGFYALGLVAIIASLRVIILANPVHAILSMIVTLLALAGIFFIIGAPFAGALQVIVYAGAILVLFVFVIMMLNLGVKNDTRESRWLSSEVWAVPAGLTAIIAIVIYAMLAMGNNVHSGVATTGPMLHSQAISAKIVGISLFSHYLMLVEVAAMLLLAALVAAYHLGKKALDDENVSHSQLPTFAKAHQTDVVRGAGGHTYDAADHLDEDYDEYQYRPVDASEFKASDAAIDSSNSNHKNNADKTSMRQTGIHGNKGKGNV